MLDRDGLLPHIKRRYGSDPMLSAVVQDPSSYRNFAVRDGYVFLRSNQREMLCVPNVIVDGRSIREQLINQAHSVLAHLGATKTLAYLREYVWWKDIVRDTTAFCDSCATCKRTKPSNQYPLGRLHTLSVPSRPWQRIGMDFVGPLPLSKNRDGEFNAITTVIDLLTGMVAPGP